MQNKLNKYICFIIFPILLIPIPKANSLPSDINQKEIEKTKISISENETDTNYLQSEYLLGPSDEIYIKFEGIDIFSRKYSVDPEGFLNLPELDRFFVNGLTTKETKRKLQQEYSKYIFEPNIKISIITYRPISFYIFGEVKSPGLYSFTSNSNEVSNNPINDVYYQIGLERAKNDQGRATPPKLFNALQIARGVTNYADLSKIEVVRNNSISNGGGKIKAKINLLNLILDGDQTPNIRVFDGDSIFIPKNNNPIKSQIIAINQSNINPDIITVYITGNVVRGGAITLKKGSSLVQAIASSGGKKLMTGNVEFLRFNEYGVSKKYKFRYDGKAEINTKKNPILSQGDIINVNRTLLGKTTEIINEFSNPIISGLGIYSIFD